LSPVEPQVPVSGALIGIKVPSIADPCKLKYQEIAVTVLPPQPSVGVNPPEPVSNAEVSSESVKVLVEDGVIPASDRKVKVGRVWKSLTTVWKYATASSPLTLPLGKQLGSRVLKHVPWVAHSCSQNASLVPPLLIQNSFIKVNVSLAPLSANKVPMPV